MEFLIIDDNPSDRELIIRELRKEYPDAEFREIIRRTDFAEALLGGGVDVAVIDYRLQWTDGLWVLQQLREKHPDLPVVMATDPAGEQIAVDGMKRGLSDYVLKRDLHRLPFAVNESLEKAQLRRERDESLRRLKVAEAALRRQNAELKQAVKRKYRFDNIIGNSDAMLDVLKKAEQVALTDATVLIYGETGTGKELVARAIHESSPRSPKNLVAINCGAIPKELLESELFGHEKGAFTGATTRRIGRFKEADGGTLLLDEIGDMPLDLQVKLLRVLQEGAIQRLGSNRDISVDVRIIAATHEDLTELISMGKFREDLYYRLKVFDLEIPPLRERREDIPLLINHFLAEYSERLGKQVMEVEAPALNALCYYDYPGNVRELEHIIERSIILCEEDRITHNVLPRELITSSKSETATKENDLDGDIHIHMATPKSNDELKKAKSEAQHKIEFLFLTDLLSSTQGNVSEAARRAGMNRYWLIELIKKHELDVDQFRDVG